MKVVILAWMLFAATLVFAAEEAVSPYSQCSNTLSQPLDRSVNAVDNISSKFTASLNISGQPDGAEAPGFNVFTSNGMNYSVSLPTKATETNPEYSLYCGRMYFQGQPIYFQVKKFKQPSDLRPNSIRLSEQSSFYQCDSKTGFSDVTVHKGPSGHAEMQAAIQTQIKQITESFHANLSIMQSRDADPKNWIYQAKLELLPQFLKAMEECQKLLASDAPVQTAINNELQKMKTVLDAAQLNKSKETKKVDPQSLSGIIDSMDRQVGIQLNSMNAGSTSGTAGAQ
jgi:hypothetical protein